MKNIFVTPGNVRFSTERKRGIEYFERSFIRAMCIEHDVVGKRVALVMLCTVVIGAAGLTKG